MLFDKTYLTYSYSSEYGFPIAFGGRAFPIKPASAIIETNSGHVVTRDVDRSLIFEEIITHFKSQI